VTLRESICVLLRLFGTAETTDILLWCKARPDFYLLADGSIWASGLGNDTLESVRVEGDACDSLVGIDW